VRKSKLNKRGLCRQHRPCQGRGKETGQRRVSLLTALAWRHALTRVRTLLVQFDSDLLVGVKHHSDGHAHGSGGQVLRESDTDGAVVAVAGNNLAPSASVSLAGLGILALVDVGDALSMVELGGGTINASLNMDKCLS
jgi:hypothetical protein